MVVHLQQFHGSKAPDPSTFDVLDELFRGLAMLKVSSSKLSGGGISHHQHWLLLTLPPSHPEGAFNFIHV